MGVSIDQVPVDWSGANADRWLFHLSEPLNGHHGGALLVDGRTVEPVDVRVLKRFVVGHGNVMVGALRVVGEPLELGDAAALRPPAEVEAEQPKVEEREPPRHGQEPLPEVQPDPEESGEPPPEPLEPEPPEPPEREPYERRRSELPPPSKGRLFSKDKKLK